MRRLTVDESGKPSGRQGQAVFRAVATAVQSAARRPLVIHAHCPYATALAASGRALDQPFLPEAVVSPGPTIPACATDGTGNPASGGAVAACAFHDVVLIAGNGVLDMATASNRAYLRVELLEHLCRIFCSRCPSVG